MNLLFSRISGLAVTLFIILFSSCKDDDPAPSKLPLLVNKTWIIVSYEMNGQDLTEDREECETDNTTTFFADGTFIADIGTMACDEFETDNEGTWVFKANETILSIHPSGEAASDWQIVELTEDRLEILQYIQAFEAEIVITMGPQ